MGGNFDTLEQVRTFQSLAFAIRGFHIWGLNHPCSTQRPKLLHVSKLHLDSKIPMHYADAPWYVEEKKKKLWQFMITIIWHTHNQTTPFIRMPGEQELLHPSLCSCYNAWHLWLMLTIYVMQAKIGLKNS